MYRTKTCGELRLADVGTSVTLAGWVQRIRKMGGMTFIDLRDRMALPNLYLIVSKTIHYSMKQINWGVNIVFRL